MQLKVSPRIGPRYWTVILIASMCGTNLGDLLLEYFELRTSVCLAIWASCFAGVVVADGLTSQMELSPASLRIGEVYYWLLILIVRAAATNIADFSSVSARLGYAITAMMLAIILTGLIAIQRRFRSDVVSSNRPPVDGHYWLTMLTAGALGTVIGDGISFDLFTRVWVGIPVSAALASFALALVLGARTRMMWASATSFWLAIVCVRWWGTNVGDGLAIKLSLPISLTLTALALASIIIIWRDHTLEGKNG